MNKIIIDNKGFAITSTIYGFLVLFLIVLLSILAILRSENNRSIIVSERIENNTFLKTEKTGVYDDDTTSFLAPQRGKYYFDIIHNDGNENTNGCYVYLPSNGELAVDSGIIKINSELANVLGCTEISNVASIKINEFYVAGIE